MKDLNMIKPHGLWGSDVCNIGGNTHTGEEVRNLLWQTEEQGSSKWHQVQRVLSHSLIMSKLLRKASVFVSIRMSNPSFVTP